MNAEPNPYAPEDRRHYLYNSFTQYGSANAGQLNDHVAVDVAPGIKPVIVTRVPMRTAANSPESAEVGTGRIRRGVDGIMEFQGPRDRGRAEHNQPGPQGSHGIGRGCPTVTQGTGLEGRSRTAEGGDGSRGSVLRDQVTPFKKSSRRVGYLRATVEDSNFCKALALHDYRNRFARESLRRAFGTGSPDFVISPSAFEFAQRVLSRIAPRPCKTRRV